MDQDSVLPLVPRGNLPTPRGSRGDAAPAPRLHARRIVVACPEPMQAETVERVLRHHAQDLAPEGIEVRRVLDGLTCLQDIQLTPPDLLILHARLEDMSAVEILQSWDVAHPGTSLPVIVLSANFGSDVPRGMPGAVVVNLPFDTTELMGIVARALSEGSAGHA
jgi:DNA-binding response OmpR family regulator